MKGLTLRNEASEPGLGRTEARAPGNSCHRSGQWWCQCLSAPDSAAAMRKNPTDPLLLCCSFKNICLSALRYVTTLKLPRGGERNNSLLSVSPVGGKAQFSKMYSSPEVTIVERISLSSFLSNFYNDIIL